MHHIIVSNIMVWSVASLLLLVVLIAILVFILLGYLNGYNKDRAEDALALHTQMKALEKHQREMQTLLTNHLINIDTTVQDIQASQRKESA